MLRFSGFGASFRCTLIIFRMHRRIIILSILYFVGLIYFSILDLEEYKRDLETLH
jgi:hypothetical protein